MASVALQLDVSGLDNRPPLLDLGLMVRRESYWVLLIAREDDLAQRFEALPHYRIGQCVYDGGIEAINDFLGVPLVVHRPCQNEMLSPGTPDSIIVGVFGDFGHRCSLMTAKAFNLPA